MNVAFGRRPALVACGAWTAGTLLGNRPAWCEPRTKRRVALLYQGPDGHRPTTHEFQAGVDILARLLQRREGFEVKSELAGKDFPASPSAFDGFDVVLLFLAEGARWLSAEPRRLDLFQKFAARGGGLMALHWAIGTRTAEPVDAFVRLFGACHGGPDRKYVETEKDLRVASPDHPIVKGLAPVRIKDEFYYALKAKGGEIDDAASEVTPLLQIEHDGKARTVAWAWSRPDGGRSFGFSGFHFHEVWRSVSYRRLVAQATAWCGKIEWEASDADLELPDEAYGLPSNKKK